MNDIDPTRIVCEGYDAIARAYHEQRDKFKNQGLLAMFASSLPAGGHVLDVGCGAGVPVARFLLDSGFDVTGVDVSSSMLALARSHVPEADLVKMDMRELRFEANSFDGVCAFYSLFHIPQEEHSGAIASFYRLLRQDGMLLLSTGSSAWQGIEDFHGARMFWSHPDREVTRQHVVDAGFAVMMSEVQEHGGERHYWIMAKKAHNQSLQGTP
jgi:ubiquinone/menaquinone biosynthesis C-methylase UbiE